MFWKKYTPGRESGKKPWGARNAGLPTQTPTVIGITPTLPGRLYGGKVVMLRCGIMNPEGTLVLDMPEEEKQKTTEPSSWLS